MASHKTPARRRRLPLFIRTTKGERAILDAAARLGDEPTGRWVRQVAVAAARSAIAERDDERHLKRFRGQMVGRVLRQQLATGGDR